jgi:putative hydrolase of the HAD superfamily
MTPSADLRVLFRAPAGARRGFGHVVRCVSLARALGVRPLIALRGPRQARYAALRLGADLVASPTVATIAALKPDVVVIDDPISADARRWIRAARKAGALAVTMHDLGLGCHDGDLRIDGSLTRAASGARALSGPRYAVLDPALRDTGTANAGVANAGVANAGVANAGVANVGAAYQAARRRRTVLIALGGGPHARRAESIATRIVRANPDAEVQIAAGFVSPAGAGPVKRRQAHDRVRWIGPQRGLAGALARASIAIVGGGVSLYEACALGVPAVTIPVVAGQRPTVRAFARRGAARAVAGGTRAAADAALALLADQAARQELAPLDRWTRRRARCQCRRPAGGWTGFMTLERRLGGEVVRFPFSANSAAMPGAALPRTGPQPLRRPARGLIVDLDDTLYARREFLRSGFRAVAVHAASAHGIDAVPLFATMERALSEGESSKALQRLCTEHALPHVDVQSLLQIFRDHTPVLTLDDDVAPALRRMRAGGWRIVVLTNGLPSVQERKLTALGVAALVDHVVYAEQFAPKGKPAPDTFRQALGRLGLPAARCVCVGDDPINDIAGARAVGLRTIRLTRHTDLTPKREADSVARHFDEVPAIAAGLLEKGASDAA